MLLDKNTRLVMIGDSITDSGRSYDAQPAGWGSYGDGHVSLINACLTGLAPAKQIMVINKGVNGNTILDLRKRWQKDVIDLRPDWVSIMIGINDVWRHYDAVLQQIEQVDETVFEKTYDELIEETKPKVKGIIIMSPFMIEPKMTDDMRKMTDAYAAIAEKTAKKHNLIYIDVQRKMDTFMESLSSYILSSDRVHPNLQGHMIIAKAFLDGIQFDWNT